MENLNKNLKYLRIRKRLSQTRLSHRIGIGASSISAYEKRRSTPKISSLLKYSKYFNRKLEELVNEDISLSDQIKQQDTKGDQLRVLPILVDSKNEEMISLVPVKAAAGYLNGYSDAEFISELPNFRMPFSELSENKTYRAFQIEGDSMLPVPAGSYIICEYVQDWEHIKDDSCCIVLTADDGIVYKRIKKDFSNNQLLLNSDNSEYLSFEVSLNQVLEVWKSLGFVSFNLPDAPQK
ncbi:LexA family transcriptional regulator [Labilibaculum sp. DW002]|uniref:LexA family transcriptional regulator n=1 Tax=Paralabilibaculum antarcticum TaxID=2912572 RepID=A0ABT5VTM4_9BACT|nr:LexA family transcriptional regulator [Labilibaculum sp. DW002]MDE5418773.1 LexA family transcriptional regulator [Labilibaculum sp. DW002]